MSILSDQIRDQLRARFQERLTGPVEIHLYTRPGSGRLILPTGLGCATCGDTQELAEELRDASSGLISLELVDVSAGSDAPHQEVPTLTVGTPGEVARIRFQGLPAGYEFATLVDAVERVSRAEVGLSPGSLERLEAITEPIEVMVFTTPT